MEFGSHYHEIQTSEVYKANLSFIKGSKQPRLIFLLLLFIRVFRRGKKHPNTFLNKQYLDLFWGPLVQVDWLYSGYMYSQVPVDAGASYADKHSQIPGSPSWTWQGGKTTTGGFGYKNLPAMREPKRREVALKKRQKPECMQINSK